MICDKIQKKKNCPPIPDKEGKPSIARRYKYIPEEFQQKVVDKYFDFHKGHLGVASPNEVGKHEAKLIAGFIYGDLGFRLPSYEQSLIYAEGQG